jgi:hypothetical protein
MMLCLLRFGFAVVLRINNTIYLIIDVMYLLKNIYIALSFMAETVNLINQKTQIDIVAKVQNLLLVADCLERL